MCVRASVLESAGLYIGETAACKLADDIIIGAAWRLGLGQRGGWEFEAARRLGWWYRGGCGRGSETGLELGGIGATG